MTVSNITKKQALANFTADILPGIQNIEESMGVVCEPSLRREAWDNYTKDLLKEGYITHEQFNTWTNPF